jgi:RNA polymerase sigma factor (sigma-70 family)
VARTLLPPFETVLDDVGDDVFRFLVATLGLPEAEDCFQETFLAALRGYPDLVDGRNLRGWVFTIAHHKVIDSQRARARRPLPAGDALEVERAAAAPMLARDRTLGESAMCELWATVRELPTKQRIAVAHRFVNDLAYREIGALMGTSEAAARRNVHEALVRLREVHLR